MLLNVYDYDWAPKTYQGGGILDHTKAKPHLNVMVSDSGKSEWHMIQEGEVINVPCQHTTILILLYYYTIYYLHDSWIYAWQYLFGIYHILCIQVWFGWPIITAKILVYTFLVMSIQTNPAEMAVFLCNQFPELQMVIWGYRPKTKLNFEGAINYLFSLDPKTDV